MDVNVKIQELLDAAQKQVDDLQKQLDAAQAEVDSLTAMAVQVTADKKAQYQAGTDYGKSLIVLPSSDGDEKLYSQADEDTLVASVKAEKDKEAADAAEDVALKTAAQIKDLKEQLADLEDAAKERDQLLSSQSSANKEIADARADLDKRLDALAADFSSSPEATPAPASSDSAKA